MNFKKMTKEEFDSAKEKIKDILKQLNKKDEGAVDVSKVKKEFKDIISRANPIIIAAAEGELVHEGFSQDDLMTACDLHLELFKDAIENPNLKVPEWHPIYKFQEEHRGILHLLQLLRDSISDAKKKAGFEDSEKEINYITRIAEKLMEAESHNVRQENTLFPILERHDVEQPPAIMWAEHTEMKEYKKQMLKIIAEKEKYSYQKFLELMDGLTIVLIEKFGAHTQKEENILYEVALEVITDEEWQDIKEECDNLGYFDLKI